MTSIIPSSTSSASLVTRPVFITRSSNCLLRSCISRKLYAQKLVLPLSTSVRLFPSIRTCVLHRNTQISATGTEAAIEEADTPVADSDSGEPTQTSAADVGPAKVQPRRSNASRKSEMPPVKNEELVAGATFTGKVRSIQPFGAFIDFGAFTDGLVHVSRLSDSFVKDVGTIVSIGQEVKVRLVEANFETGRISLTMRESDDTSKVPTDADRARPPRKSGGQRPNQRRDKVSKFSKGQALVGTVKNINRSGAFITLPEGEEGFLPTSEEADGGLGSMMMDTGSSLDVGQEVNVKVLKIVRGQVTLTMKEQDTGAADSLLQGTVHTATNPFLLAFRQNKEIASFLDEREKEVEAINNDTLTPVANKDADQLAVATEESVAVVDQITEAAESNVLSESEGEPDNMVMKEEVAIEAPTVDSEASIDQVTEAAVTNIEIENEGEADNVGVKEDVAIDTPTVESEAAIDQVTEAAVTNVEIENNGEADNVDVKEEVIIDTPTVESETAIDQVTEAAVTNVEIENEGEANNMVVKEEVAIDTPSVESEAAVDQVTEAAVSKVEIESEGEADNVAVNEEAIETPSLEVVAVNEEAIETPSLEVETSSSTLVEDQNLTPEESTTDESQISEVAENGVVKDELQTETPTVAAEPAESINKSNEQSSTPVPKENNAKVTISPTLVKQLREETGAGMMDCKNALSETGGDIIKAQEFLRKKGLASADKKASRATAEGRIGSYIHDSRIGVLIEVNCETDFVSRGDIFKELVDDLAMQVAACPQVQYLVTDDVPKDIVEKEKEIEMQKEDLLSKPEQIRAKIVEGRIRKRLEELALLEQPYIKNDKLVVKDWVKQNIATIGENIKVKRFVRFNLGEGLEKKSQDFAAEVAAQTAAKAIPLPVKEAEPASAVEVEAKEAVEKPPKPTISAALVKQLREETGAGMMDCKKALSETEGDIVKAQEYLRKKGLSTADKKSSRLAAEGRIGSYIHDSRIGVLIEVNCETDFVGRSEKFKELADDLAMQVVACPSVEYVSVEDIPESVVSKEKELEMQREDILSKPENIRERIVEGRVAKRLGELALLEQSFIKDDSVVVKDLVKQTVAALGENIKVRRFVRFTLGEDN